MPQEGKDGNKNTYMVYVEVRHDYSNYSSEGAYFVTMYYMVPWYI